MQASTTCSYLLGMGVHQRPSLPVCCCACVALRGPGSLLKEAVEDLEWPGSAVAVKLVQDPPTISLSAHGTGSLEVRASTGSFSVMQPAGEPAAS